MVAAKAMRFIIRLLCDRGMSRGGRRQTTAHPPQRLVQGIALELFENQI